MTIDIEQYFASFKDDGGVWYEPSVQGHKIGIEFFIHGPNSNLAITADEQYRRLVDISEKITNTELKNELRLRALAEKYSICITDIRGKYGKTPTLGGRSLSVKDLAEILYKAPAILSDIDIYFRTYNKNFQDNEESIENAVKSYFYMHQPYTEKISIYNPKTKKKETKTKTVRNIDKKNDFLKKFHEEAFEEACATDIRWAKMKEIPMPNGAKWVFGHFLEIWYSCESDFVGNKIFRPKDITEYCECFGVKMNIYEKRLIMKMKYWAVVAINELQNETES
ncbi:MAG: hypothetical protein KBT03_07545 [Bacteroidales bacterium]|nr:hypothetical protein [Candidatus Scybalousia scybalohippi]